METLQNRNVPYLVGNTHDEGGGMTLLFGKDMYIRQLQQLFGAQAEELLADWYKIGITFWRKIQEIK